MIYVWSKYKENITDFQLKKTFLEPWKPALYYIGTVKFLYQDHLWDCPKVVFKTTFGQSQRWSLIRCTLGVENEEKNSLNFQNKVFNG